MSAVGVKTSRAQVVLDGKFGPSGPVTGPNYNITAEMGSVRGNNLFQSFSQFNLNAGEVAAFSGPKNIQNILSRVTGGSASSINGTIRSDITGANFFFINPNGMVFGPNAAIDVSGSFAASTANYLKLADGARFVAALDADDSGLSSAPVAAFGFLGPSAGGISVQQSTLSVPSMQSITLVGGDVIADGGVIQAPQGRINVASVQSAGEVPVDPASLTAAQFNAAFPQQGQIDLLNQARFDASGEGGGRIVIRGGRLTVDNSKIESNTTGATDGQGIDVGILDDLNILNLGQINSLSTAGLGAGGNININAGSILLDGGGLVDENFMPATQISTATGDVFTGGDTGKGGDIIIQTGSLELVNSAQISAATFGLGDAGRIDITASSILLDALAFTTTRINASSEPFFGPAGNAGDIVINAGTFEMRNAATTVAASNGEGNAGQVQINAQTVNLLSGSVVIAGTYGAGNGGNVQITADTLSINGQDTLTGGPDLLTGIQAFTTSPDFAAPGGNIQLDVGSLQMDHAGRIITASLGAGAGGNVNIQAGQVSLANGSSISAAQLGDPYFGALGPAGTVSITSDQNVVLTGGSSISTSAFDSSGGDISVTAGNQIQLTDSQITSQAGPGGGGNISVSAPAMIYLLNSTLTAQAEGDGGNLSIVGPEFFIMNNGGLISMSSSANGGNITILSDYFFQSGSTIDASAPFGLPGTVSVSAPQIDLSGVLVGLPGNLLDAENQLRPDCAVRLVGDVSSFVVLGRGGLPLAPGGFVPSGPVTTP
ncbi:MAG TPA: filamentous hemagglutinin N-terminal domain-containing protein [Verrucomicrobiae bacterium]|nr:filamentous hemagglutinin N-terminal domain-containing protein [Verrucomicrobiae bacterium]